MYTGSIPVLASILFQTLTRYSERVANRLYSKFYPFLFCSRSVFGDSLDTSPPDLGLCVVSRSYLALRFRIARRIQSRFSSIFLKTLWCTWIL